MSVIAGLAQYIGANVAGLKYSAIDTTGNVFEDTLPPTPDLAVAVVPAGGLEADSLLPYDAPTPQILVRAAQRNARAAEDLWRAIYAKVHGLRNVVLPDGTYLVYALAIQSDPVRIGSDLDERTGERPLYSMNLRCEVVSATPHRPAPTGS